MKSYEKTVSALGADRFEPHTPEVPIKVKDAENCRLNAVILSDLHLSQTKPERTENIFHCINDLSFAKSRIDVLSELEQGFLRLFQGLPREGVRGKGDLRDLLSFGLDCFQCLGRRGSGLRRCPR